MRSHNKYLEKVREELDVYRAHLLDGGELSFLEKKIWASITLSRQQLLEGQSDFEIIRALKNDPAHPLQERRAREVLAMAYEIFGDLRLNRNSEGVKYMYAQIFRDSAMKALNAGDYESFKNLMKEAAKIDGAYDAEKMNVSDKKKPTKVIIKRVTKSVNNQLEETDTEEAQYEVE